MGYKSGGLSYFSNGSSTSDTEEQKPTAFQAKPTAPKGRFGLPTPAGNVPVNQSVLDQMEQLYIQRQANRTGFMESLKDASAWFSGGVEGPQQALLARDKFRQEQEGEDFQMQSQIAQYRSALAAQKAFEERRARELGLTGAPGAPGAAAPSSPEAMFGMPPEIRQALMNAPTRAEYDKIYAEYAKKKAEVEASPEFDVPKIPVVVKAPDGSYYRDVISARELRSNPAKYMRQDEMAAREPRAGAAPPEAAAPAPLPGAQQPRAGAPAAQAAATPQAAPAPRAPSINVGNDMTTSRLTGEELNRRIAALSDHPNKAQLEARLRSSEADFKNRIASEPNPRRVASQEEFNSLPEGTVYQLPDGVKGIKGGVAASSVAGTTPRAAAPGQFTYENLTPEMINNAKQRMALEGLQPELFDRPDAAELFNKQPLKARENFFSVNSAPPAAAAPAPQAAAPAAPAAPLAQAPAAPRAQAPAGRRPTAPELERQAEIEKQMEINAAQEKFKTDAKKREVFETDIDATKITERQGRARRAQELVKSDPTIAGVISGPGYKNAIAGLLQEGISTPSGSISLSSISDAIYKTLPTTMDTAKRSELAGILANMELDASAVMNGQGQISDGERVILRKAAISIEDPAEVVYKKARMMEARQETLKKLGELYGDGSKYIRNFGALKADPQYKAIQDQYERRLEEIYNEKVNLPKPAKGARPGRSAGPQPYSDAEKERRYQEWKRQQGTR